MNMSNYPALADQENPDVYVLLAGKLLLFSQDMHKCQPALACGCHTCSCTQAHDPACTTLTHYTIKALTPFHVWHTCHWLVGSVFFPRCAQMAAVPHSQMPYVVLHNATADACTPKLVKAQQHGYRAVVLAMLVHAP